MTEAQVRDVRGNAEADALAKKALARHPALAPADSIELGMEWEDALATARLIAAAGPLWPAARPPDGRRLPQRTMVRAGCANLPPRALRAREAARIAATHDWCVMRGATRCRNCWAAKSKHGAATQAPCPGQSSLHRKVVSQAPKLGHDLWAAEVVRAGREPTPLLLCMQCGAFVECGRNQLLHDSACRPPGKHGMMQISRVRNGLHPRTGDVGRGASLQHLQRLWLWTMRA